MSDNRALAIVDATGMVWENPDMVDKYNRNVTILYTPHEVEAAKIRMNKLIEVSKQERMRFSTQDIHTSAISGADVEVDELAFKSLSDALGM